MPRGYWILHFDIADCDGFGAYVEAAMPALDAHGARFLAQGGRHESPEAEGRTMNVIIEFPDYDSALACYRSETYQNALPRRQAATEGSIVITEGL